MRLSVSNNVGLKGLTIVASIAIIAAVGCGQKPAITTYTADRDVIPAEFQAEIDLPESKEKLRILGAFVAAGNEPDTWWVFKMQGGPNAVGNRVKDFTSLLSSMIVESYEEDPTLEFPAGWYVMRPDNQFAKFKIRTGNPLTPLDMTVTPSRGALLENVTRWTDQVSMKPLTKDQLPTVVRELTTKNMKKVYLVDVTGKPNAKGMMAPFAMPK